MLDTVNDDRDPGVTVSETLSFSKYIASAVVKVNRMLGIMRHSFSYLNKKSLLV